MAYFKKKRWSEALRELRGGLKQNRNDLEARYYLGQVYFKQGKYDRARVELEKVVAINPRHSDAHAVLANTYEKLGRSRQATHSTGKSVQIDSAAKTTQPKRSIDYGKMMIMGGDVDGAIEVYQKKLKKNPQDHSTRLKLAEAYTQKKDWRNAEREYRKILGAMPKASNARVGLAKVYARQGLRSKAVEEYRSYLKYHPRGKHSEDAKNQIARLTGKKK